MQNISSAQPCLVAEKDLKSIDNRILKSMAAETVFQNQNSYSSLSVITRYI